MEKQMSGIGRIRSDLLRAVVAEAVKQSFELDWSGNHPALICPVCKHREVITATGKQSFHESRNKVCRLRRHGLMWKGRGGEHVAKEATG
jgi:hypothetical protein